MSAKFEEFYQDLVSHAHVFAYNNPLGLPVEGDMKGAMWLGWKHAIQSLEVTDGLCYMACKVGRITRDEPPSHELAKMRRTLEAVLSALKEQAK